MCHWTALCGYFAEYSTKTLETLGKSWKFHSRFLDILGFWKPSFSCFCCIALLSFTAIVAARYPETLDEFYQARLPGTFDDSKAGKRMRLQIPETWETQVALKGNKAGTWQDLIGNLCHYFGLKCLLWSLPCFCARFFRLLLYFISMIGMQQHS